jgi:hypothetical protein
LRSLGSKCAFRQFAIFPSSPAVDQSASKHVSRKGDIPSLDTTLAFALAGSGTLDHLLLHLFDKRLAGLSLDHGFSDSFYLFFLGLVLSDPATNNVCSPKDWLVAVVGILALMLFFLKSSFFLEFVADILWSFSPHFGRLTFSLGY